MPFKLPNGAYYFEAVGLLPESPKRYRESFLALCPNHAAAYRFANAQLNATVELVVETSGNEVEVALRGEETTVYCTQMHLADIRAVIAAEEEPRA